MYLAAIAKISWRRHSHCSLVVTFVPSKKVNGSGSLSFFVRALASGSFGKLHLTSAPPPPDAPPALGELPPELGVLVVSEVAVLPPELGVLVSEVGPLPPELGALVPEVGPLPPELVVLVSEVALLPPELGVLLSEVAAVPPELGALLSESEVADLPPELLLVALAPPVAGELPPVPAAGVVTSVQAARVGM